jgi:hypothetical protein
VEGKLMADEQSSSWNVYRDPAGDPGKREHVETCPTNGDAKAIMDYLAPRLPETDRVSTTFGPVVAPGGLFDRARLLEPQNDWPHEAMAPMKAIEI